LIHFVAKEIKQLSAFSMGNLLMRLLEGVKEYY